MKFPKGFSKLTNEEQRIWVAQKIASVQTDLDELKNISRKLQRTGFVYTPKSDEDRLDLVELKS